MSLARERPCIWTNQALKGRAEIIIADQRQAMHLEKSNIERNTAEVWGTWTCKRGLCSTDILQCHQENVVIFLCHPESHSVSMKGLALSLALSRSLCVCVCVCVCVSVCVCFGGKTRFLENVFIVLGARQGSWKMCLLSVKLTKTVSKL